MNYYTNLEERVKEALPNKLDTLEFLKILSENTEITPVGYRMTDAEYIRYLEDVIRANNFSFKLIYKAFGILQNTNFQETNNQIGEILSSALGVKSSAQPRKKANR